MLAKIVRYLQVLKRNPYWSMRLVISRMLLMTGLSTLFTIKLGDMKLKFFPTQFSADLWFPSKDIFEDYSLPFLKQGDTVIDVGANIGVTSLLFKKYIGASGKVFAFEPDPRVFGYLKSNIEMNKLTNIHLFNCALGEGRKKAYLQMHKKGDTGNAITLNKEDGLMIDMDYLDALTIEYGINVVDLLKIDTEGYEKFVFLGGKDILSHTKVIIFEAIPANCHKYNYHLKEVVDMLENMNFHVYCCSADSGEFYKIDVQLYMRESGRYLHDLFAVKDSSLLQGVKWA